MSSLPLVRRYLRIALPVPINATGVLTYHLDLSEEPWSVLPSRGCRVVVPLQRRQALGFVLDIEPDPPSFPTSSIIAILDDFSLLPDDLLDLSTWMAATFVCPVGEVLQTMLPAGVKRQLTPYLVPAVDFSGAEPGSSEEREAWCWLLNQYAAPSASSASSASSSPSASSAPSAPSAPSASSAPSTGKAAVTVAQFCRLFPTLRRRLPNWCKEKRVDLRYSLSRVAGPKVYTLLELNPDTCLADFSPTEKERLVIELLLRNNCAMSAVHLRKELAISAAPLQQLLRKGILRTRTERVWRQVGHSDPMSPVVPPPTLTPDQETVLELLRQRATAPMPRSVLIRGVTCSGKTEVYLRWVAEVLQQGKSALVLVPEISLTPQMRRRFRERFGTKVAILHSKLATGERFDQWDEIRRGNCPVVVGARSAVFAPLPNLGTIIIDEEGEPTFKQSDSPRYHAREVAAHRCHTTGSLLVMGSATPTLETYHLARQNVIGLADLPQRVGGAKPPCFEIVDMREELVTKKNRSMFSEALSRAIQQSLQEQGQIMLYLNRRGHSSFVFCRACGHAMSCEHCQTSLVFHKGSKILRCHYCGNFKTVPDLCPVCKSADFRFFGAGTQRIEQEAKRYFPQARVARLDSDTTTHKDAMENILAAFGRGEIDILVGTQMIAKGLDFPNVRVVGIMAADGLLRLPDFRAAERNFALLAQMGGRSGRSSHPGKVILQTYFPEHHSIRFALTEDYPGFYQHELDLRQKAGFPPFRHIAVLTFSAAQEERAQQLAESWKAAFLKYGNLSDAEILGPGPAPLARIREQYRFQCLVKHPQRTALSAALTEVLTHWQASSGRAALDIDPYFSL